MAKTALVKSIGLDGTLTFNDGTVQESKYFDFLKLNPDDYSEISFTPEEALKIKRHFQWFSTGSSSALPMVCFPADSLVCMSDLTVKPIQEIKPGDYVVTHLGNIKKVKRVFERGFQGILVRFRQSFSSKLFSAWSTPNHEYMVRQVGYSKCAEKIFPCPACGLLSKKPQVMHLKNYQDNEHLAKEQGRDVQTSWIPVEQLSGKDFVGTPKILQCPSGLSKEQEALAIALGFYLAEGSIDKKDNKGPGDNVTYTLNINETNYADQIEEAWKVLGYKARRYYKPTANSLIIRIHGYKPARLMRNLGGRYSDRLSPAVLQQSSEFLKTMLRCFFYGDAGYEQPSRNYEGDVGEIKITSRDLAWQIYFICVSLGLTANIPKPITGSNKGEQRKLVWSWCLNTRSLFEQVDQYHSYFADNVLWRSSKTRFVKEQKSFSGIVYNLEIEDDNSYLVNGLAVHNCGGKAKCFVAQTGRCPYVRLDEARKAVDSSAPVTTPVGRTCHPPGEQILTRHHGYVKIEELDKNIHKLIGYERHHNTVRKGRMTHGYSFRTASRYYVGNLITIITDTNKQYNATEDHICIARFNEKAIGKFCVYLMQRGAHWRVGKSRLIGGSPSSKHKTGLVFTARGKKEDADAMWLLGVYDTNTEALLAEEKFSVEWGISKSLFLAHTPHKKQNRKDNGLVTQEELDAHHESFNIPLCHVAECLKGKGLSIDFPIWTRAGLAQKSTEAPEDTKLRTRHGFYIRACNLLSEVMDVPVYPKTPHGKEKSWIADWETIKVSKKAYQGPVYSLEVEKHGTYFVNEIATHNCPVELNLLNQWTLVYMQEYEIDEKSFTELQMVRELAEIELMLWRLDMNLAKPEHAQLVEDVVVAVDKEGNPLSRKETSALFNTKEKLQNRKTRVIKLLVGDRQEKYKRDAALKTKSADDPSMSAAKLRQKMDRIMDEVGKVNLALKEATGKVVDAEVEEETDDYQPLTPDDLIGGD